MFTKQYYGNYINEDWADGSCVP